MFDQLVAVFAAVIAEPIIRAIKVKFAPSKPVMLLITVAVAGVGATAIVLYQSWQSGEVFNLESVLALVPTIFAVGQVIYALL